MSKHGGKQLMEGIKGLVKSLFKIGAILCSFLLKLLATISEKLSEFFEKLGSK